MNGRFVSATAIVTLCALVGGASAATPTHTSIDAVGIDGVAVNNTTAGTDLVVTGVTNRQPDEAAVLLSLRATNGTTTRLTSTDTWSWDGRWSATFDLDGAPPGLYRVEATTGGDTDVEYVRIDAPPGDAATNGTGNVTVDTARPPVTSPV